MEVPSSLGDIPRCRFCVHTNIQNGCGNGYFKCDRCYNREKGYDTDNYIVHDIAVLSKENRIRWAIEVITAHEPDWESELILKYPVFLVESNSILQQISNEDYIKKKNILVYARILNGSRNTGRLFKYGSKND